jgi:hypothetical protein
MIITHLELKNWRNLGEIGFYPYIYIDRLSSSETENILDAFYFLHLIAQRGGGGLQGALYMNGSLNKIYGRNASREQDIFILIKLTDSQEPDAINWSYELAFKLQAKKLLAVTRERVTRNNEELFCRPDSDDLLDEERLTQTFLEQVNANAKFRVLAKFFASDSYYDSLLKLQQYSDDIPTKYNIRRRKKA